MSIGLLTGMAFTLWISFGGPRPNTVKLPLSVEGCSHNVTQPEPAAYTNPSDYFYLYRISYMWTSVVRYYFLINIFVIVTAVVKYCIFKLQFHRIF